MPVEQFFNELFYKYHHNSITNHHLSQLNLDNSLERADIRDITIKLIFMTLHVTSGSRWVSFDKARISTSMSRFYFQHSIFYVLQAAYFTY